MLWFICCHQGDFQKYHEQFTGWGSYTNRQRKPRREHCWEGNASCEILLEIGEFDKEMDVVEKNSFEQSWRIENSIIYIAYNAYWEERKLTNST